MIQICKNALTLMKRELYLTVFRPVVVQIYKYHILKNSVISKMVCTIEC